jgi:hypothetical protein
MLAKLTGVQQRWRQSGILFRRIHVNGYEWIVDSNVFDLTLVGALDIARGRCFRSFEERFEHRVPDQNGMPVFSLVLWNHCPLPFGYGPFEGGLQRLDGRGTDWRTINESEHRGVATAVSYLLQPDLQGAELPAIGIGIDHQRGAIGIHDWRQRGFVLTDHDEHNLDVGKKQPYGGGEKRVAPGGWGPRQQRFFASHARRLTGRENYSAKIRGSPHVGTITNCGGSAKKRSGGDIDAVSLVERGQFDQVIVGNSFHGLSGLAPSAKTAGDDEHFESDIL